MNVLIVYAHPEPQSFNGALKELAVATLTGAGHAVSVSDLYAMKFNPIAEPDQFPARVNPTFFHLQTEQRHAAATGTTAPDVAAEQEKLFWADLIIFQFPLWWGSMPAILKGWIDRVFSVGTIYGRGVDGLQGRRALLSATTSAGDADAAATQRRKDELGHVLNNMFALPQLEVLEPFFVFGPAAMDPDGRAVSLRAYEQRLLSILGQG